MTEESKIDALAEELRTQIRQGGFGTEGRLPAVTKIARDHKLARDTVYEVLRLLQSEGLLIGRDQSYFVNYPIHRIPGAPLFDKYLKEQGLEPTVENIIEPQIIQIPNDIAEMFKQQQGIRVIHRVRVHGTKKAPIRLQDSFYPFDLAGPFLDAMRKDPNLNVMGEIRKATGLVMEKWHDGVLARLPSAEETKLLDIVRTTPVLEVRRHFMATNGTSLLFAKVVFVAAYVQLDYDVTRDINNL